jgi:signal transduction histidine kinase
MRPRSVLVAVGAGLVTVGALVPMSASAQVPPPSTVPDIGLPPVTTRPVDAPAPGVTGGGSSRHSGGADDGSFGAAVVRTFTEPGALVGALILALGLGVVVGAALRLSRSRRRPRSRRPRSRRQREPLEQSAPAPAHEHAVAAKLAEADQQRSEFLALVSHEMRTPLTAVKGVVDTVRLHWEELPETRRRDLLDRASLNADELNRLVGQLLDFSRLDARRVTMTPQPILVSEAVERTIKDLGPALADHHVYLDIPAGLAMLADVAAFGEVMTNLLTNAAKFSPAGRRIIVSATLAEGAVDISVADEGGGIPRDEQDLIFDPFYQSPSNKLSRRGTGIGLTIAKRFTEMQGGQIAVVSEPGLGSTFWVTMPAAAGPVRKIGDTHHEVAS